MLKCICWDLDGTIWNGTLAYDESVTLKEEALRLIKAADKAGIMQSVASRNDYSKAVSMMKKLEIDHFFMCPQLDGARSKAVSLRNIAKHLNIDENSIAFVDDNPFELYEVKYYMPEVVTVSAENMSELNKHIEAVLRQSPVTENRRELMRARDERILAEQNFNGSREDFLKECRMVLSIREAKHDDISRAAELAQRTNRLNNTRERMDIDQIRAYADERDKYLFVCGLNDIFGFHGIIGTGLFRVEGDALHIDLFCVSCRVEGRGIGAAFLSDAINRVSAENPAIKQALCNYRIYEKDKSAYLLLKLLGFTAEKRDDGHIAMRLGLPCKYAAPIWLNLEVCK